MWALFALFALLASFASFANAVAFEAINTWLQPAGGGFVVAASSKTLGRFDDASASRETSSRVDDQDFISEMSSRCHEEAVDIMSYCLGRHNANDLRVYA